MGTPVNQVKATLEPNDHPYRNGAWTPVFEELDTDDLEVIGNIPDDIDGLYVRNTENPVHDSLGRYHPFDGDGMIHTIRIKGGKATYRNRFVRTEGFEAEQQEGGPLWPGLMGNPHDALRPGMTAHGSVKDSSSTDVVVHAGAILSTFYLCGEVIGSTRKRWRRSVRRTGCRIMAFRPIARLTRRPENCCSSTMRSKSRICNMAWSVPTTG